jgi:hypothetical protein
MGVVGGGPPSGSVTGIAVGYKPLPRAGGSLSSRMILAKTRCWPLHSVFLQM